MASPHRTGAALTSEGSGLRVRVRLLGAGKLPPEPAVHVYENSTFLIEADDLDAPDPPTVRVHGLESVVPPFHEASRTGLEIPLGTTLGVVDIEVEAGLRTLVCSVEVRPRKLDYEAHYEAMKRELEELAQNLLLHAWQAAAERRGVGKADDQTPAELFDLLRGLWLELRRVFATIAVDPHRDLASSFEVVDVSRARAIGRDSLNDLARHPEYWIEHPGGQAPLPITQTLPDGRLVTPLNILEDRAEITYDTPPNRVVCARLADLFGAVQSAVRVVQAGLPDGHFGLGAEAQYLTVLTEFSGGVASMLREDFLAGAGTLRTTDLGVHILQADARYRTLLDLLRLVQMGLTPKVTGRAFSASIKELWEVYEYWVYLSLIAELLWRGWDATDADQLFRVRHSGLVLDLERGKEAAVKFVKDGRAVEVVYQRKIISRMAPKTAALQSRTHEMRPDVLVHIDDGALRRRVAVDAKYRVDENGVGPPQSAIDDLHVYRDGIGSFEHRPNGSYAFIQKLALAVAAFPGQDPVAYAGHRYEQSLEQGIGGIPWLPGVGGAAALADRFGL